MDYEIIDNSDGLQDEIVFFGGGGNLIEPKYYEMFEVLSKCVIHNKCIVLPHTIFGFRDLVSNTSGNFILFCREKVSYVLCLLNGADKKHTFLSDDMAFYLPESLLLSFRNIENTNNKAYCLREDGESGRLVPIPENNKDISLSWNGHLWINKELTKYSVISLASYLSPFSEVVTDRLHIAILAAYLDKKVVFYPNDYYKNRAVFENSICHRFPKVSFINTSTDLLHSEYVDNLLKRNNFI